MSAKAIREAAGKHLLNKYLSTGAAVKSNVAVVTADTDWSSLAQQHPWLMTEVCYIKHLTFAYYIAYLYFAKISAENVVCYCSYGQKFTAFCFVCFALVL